MAPKWKISLILGAIILILAVAFWQIWLKSGQEIAQIGGLEKEKQAGEVEILSQPEIKPATGNINDVIDALLSEITGEETLVSDETKDSALVSNDSQEIGAFMQVYDEKEF